MTPDSDLDDLKVITHILRHKCSGVTKASRAILIIVKNSDITKERVCYLIKTYFKDKYDNGQ